MKKHLKAAVGLCFSFFLLSSVCWADGGPNLQAMINHNWIAGNELPSDTQVDVSINGGDIAAFSILTDSDGHFFAGWWEYWPDQWIARGDIIGVSYGDQTVSMTVQNLNAEVDLDNNRILGTAFTPEGVPLEGRRVEVRIHEHEDWGPMLQHYESLVDEFGVFELGGDPEEFEIQKGHKLFLAVHESPDGNYAGHMTSMEPYNGIPRLEISPDHNWIRGHNFPFNSIVYILLNDDITLTAIVTTNWSGFFWKNVWEIDGYQLQPGDVIQAEYAAGEFVSATIPDSAITISTDLETNTISGTAVGFEGQSVRIDIYSQNYEELLHQADVPVDQDGLYSLEWPGLEPGQEICVVGKDFQNNEFKYHHNIPIWRITGGFLQYRTFEDEARNRYQSYIDIQKNGQSVQEHELVGSTFKDPDGNALDYLHRGFYSAQYNFFDCRTGDCIEQGPFINSGFWAIYENELVAGTYESELEMYDGQILTSMPYYPGKLALPVVSSSSMMSGYENGDLVLSWINPVSHENWDAVDELRVVLFNNWGQEILYIALNKTDALDQAITIPTNVLENAEALHGTYFAEWQVQTRAYSDHGMNYARGNSDNKPHGVRIDYAQLRFHTHENEALDVYRGAIAVSKNGLPVEENEINVVLFLDPDGNEIEALNDFFWSGEYIFYNCTTGDCIASGPHVESSFYSHFEGELSEGVYQFIIGTADGQFRSVERYYPGKLVLPVVSSSSMTSGYETGDLVLNWTNPVGHQNWDEVDQLRLVFLDNMGNDILYVTPIKTNEPEQAITIPGHILDNAEAIHGTLIVEWEVQTRSFSDDWMNYARGISSRILIDSWEEGSGTPEDPYLVREPQHLSMMRDYLSSYFRLENHIDMDGSPDWVPVGTIETPFTGGFDGNGYTVRNLFMNSSNTDYAGLFGYVQDAVIANTGLEDIDIRGGNHVGALVGYAQNTSVMECYATGFVSGLDNVGGLAGTLETDTSSLIFNSYADCDLDGGAAVGGIVGTLGASTAIENTYAVGSVQGNSDIGGLVGVNNNATHDNVVNSFWDTNIGPATSQGGTGKTTAEMMKHATYTGWDFVETWVIYESRTYPYLQWQPMPLLAFYPNLINWNGNLVADFGENGLWYHNGTSWTWMTNKGHVSQMVVWDGKLVVDFGADHGLHYYDGTWNWMSNKGDVAMMLPWHNAVTEQLVVDFGEGRRIYTYDGSWHWFNNKDAVADMTVWNNKLVVDFGNGRSVFHHDGTSWTWMTNKDDVAMMLPWDDGTSGKLVVDFGDGRRMYTYDGTWQWFNNKDDVNAMAVWTNKLVVDFGNSRGMYNYDGTWNWMTNKDDVTRLVPWNDGTADKLAVDFGGGRGMHYYDGTWNWMKNTDDVPEMIAWGNRLAVDFGSGGGIYNYDGSWNWMRNWSTTD